MSSSHHSSIVSKCTTILDLLASSRGLLSFIEIVEETGFVKSSTHRILAILQNEGLVELDLREKKYRLGSKLMHWAVMAWRRTDLQQAAIDELEKLCETTGSNVALAIRDGAGALFLRAVNNYQIRYVAKAGDHVPLHCTAVGKVLTAYLPEGQRKNIIDQIKFDRLTENSIIDPLTFESELAKVRQDGYAVCNGEEFLQVLGIAAPIYDFQGEVVASACVWSLSDRVDMAGLEKLVPHLAKSAKSISERLGFRE
jgi:DNA-binding IclR family transcriptional regulator